MDITWASIDLDWLARMNAHLWQLVIAAILGGLVGIERQIHGQWVGIRTHMAVSIGSALFVMASVGIAGDHLRDATRVIQGIAAGVGFLGAGAILKLSDRLEIKGLTTASTIWLAAALGTTTGLGLYELATAGAVASLLVLALLRPLEKAVDRKVNVKQ